MQRQRHSHIRACLVMIGIVTMFGLAQAELKQVIMFSRHAARGPVGLEFPWQNYWKDIGLGQLTPDGMRMAYFYGQ